MRQDDRGQPAQRRITRCVQSGACVEVYGIDPAAGAGQGETLFFRRPGLLRRFDAQHVVLQGTSGDDEIYDAFGNSDEYGEDLVEQLLKGDRKSIGQFFFVALVLLVAYLTGALEF